MSKLHMKFGCAPPSAEKRTTPEESFNDIIYLCNVCWEMLSQINTRMRTRGCRPSCGEMARATVRDRIRWIHQSVDSFEWMWRQWRINMSFPSWLSTRQFWHQYWF